MAIYRLHADIIRRSQGQSAVAAAAYRAGDNLYDARLDTTHYYQRKQDIVCEDILTPHGIPHWCRDRADLWNRFEGAERQWNGQPARTVDLTLPRELSIEQNWALAQRFVRDEFVSKGMIADMALHNPMASDGKPNPHVHVLLTMRRIEEGEPAKKKERQWNRDFTDGGQNTDDTQGGFVNRKGEGDGWVGKRKTGLVGLRQRWSDTANDALEQAGHSERISHLSNNDQGLDLEPQKKIGIHAKGRGGQWQQEIARANDDIRDRNEVRTYLSPENTRRRSRSIARATSRNLAAHEFELFLDSERNRNYQGLMQANHNQGRTDHER